MRRGLLIVLVLLIGLIIAADRIGVVVAQNAIAENVANEYRLDHKPKVRIGGFPFLTQALSGRYGEINVDVGDVTQRGVDLTGTTVVLKGVSASISDAANGDSSRMVADSATSTAIVRYSEVDKEAPPGVKVSAKGSALQVHGPVTVLGVTRSMTATVTVRPAGRSVRVVPQAVDANGTVVPVAAAQQAFGFTMPVRGLPLGTRISDVQVEQDGLRVTTTAEHVSLATLVEH